jgi:two-component system, chemotaxis family, CheB/CheR fusion protein
MDKAPSLVVGIGASAGGVQALQQLLKSSGECRRMAFVIVQHKGVNGSQLGVDLLSRSTSLPVREIEEGLAAEAGAVYVAPARSAVTLEQGIFGLLPAFEAGQRLSVIDASLHSIGKTFGARAVGIVLSGEGSDGTAGLDALSGFGGLTIAQAPESSEHPSMPQSAIASGSVDRVLNPDEIAAELLAYEQYLERVLEKTGVGNLREEIGAGLIRICDILHRATNLDFKHYKTTTLIRRIQRRMQVLQLNSVEAYTERLSSHGEEAEALFSELLINVTSFFRDADAFAALNNDVIVPGLAATPKGERFRIWVPGCSTGEEVYTLAMLVREQLSQMTHPPEVQILATDVDEQALAVGRKGAYPLSIERSVSRERLERFFVKRNGKYHVEKSLRELCLFSAHNLISDPPFSQLDLISCRNLLIYLGTHLQKKLIPVFHYALKANGHLFLGTSESLSTHRELFRTVSAKYRIAQRRHTAIRPVSSFSTSVHVAPASVTRELAGEAEADIHMIGQRILLDEFAPKYAIANEEGQIVSVSAGINEFFEPSEGSFQNNIVKLANPQLRMALRSVFAEAKKHKRRMEHEAATLRTPEKVMRVGITVQPMPKLGEESGLYMIVFKDLGSLPSVAEPAADPKFSAMNAALIDQLEKELAATREDLDKTVQDLEASNEELKSSNEELLSMNEELQSANEELEASKEEIQHANDALQRSNSDLENLLGSTQIATLFLDADLRIKGFTPAITQIYPIQPGDVGRRLADFASPSPSLAPLPPADSLAEDSALEDELVLPSGTVFLRRVLPYRTAQGERDGVVVTFINVTDLKKTQWALKENTEQLRLALEAGQLGTFYWNFVTREAYWSDQAYRLFGLGDQRPPVSVDLFYETMHPEDRARVTRLVEKSIAEGTSFRAEFRTLGRDGRERWLFESGNVFRDESGKLAYMLGAVQDITERKNAQITFERNLDMSPAILWITEEDGSCSYLSQQWYEHTGQTEAEALGYGWLKAVHPDDMPAAGKAFREASDGRKPFYIEYRLRTKSGAYRWAIDAANPRFDSKGKFIGMAGTVFDIHDRVVAEESRRESEKRFQIMADSAPVLVWISGEDRRRSWFNKGWLDFTGMNAEDSAGYGWLNLVHPDDRELYLKLYHESFDAKRAFQIEYRLRHHTGDYRWISARGVPRFRSDGALEGYIGACLDIHDVKMAEQAVKESQERYRTLTEVIPQLVWTCLPDGACDYLSRQWVDYTGLDELDQLGLNWLSRVVHPDDQPRTLEHWMGAVAGKHPYDIEYRIRRHDGEYRWFKTRGTPIRNEAGEIVHWFGTCTDVHDQKLANKRIEESERILKTITNNTASSLFMMDQKGRPTFMNPAAEKLTGYRLEEIRDRPLHYAVHYKKPDGSPYPMEECPIDNAQSALVAVQNQEEVFVDKAGKLYPVSFSVAPLEDQGKVLGSVLEFRDITEEKRARELLEDAIATRDEFLSIASHELKTPVTSLRLQMQILAKQIKIGDKRAADPAHLNKVAELSIRQTKQLSKLIDDMLDVSRIETGRIDLSLTAVDLGALLRDSLDGFLPQFRDAGVEVSTEIGAGLFARVDSFRLEQVFINLFTNALKYGARQPVKISAARVGEKIELAVTDQGLGIAPEHLERIFGRFERAISANEVSGLGLGLYISKKIVESHGGAIRVESELGVGTRFTVELPAEEPAGAS